MAERIAALIENQRSLTNAVSHELRTPLARLAFEVDLLRQDRSARREHILQDMQADIDELESMVAELLVYARLERPTDDMVPQETVDARDWLGDVLAQVDHLAQARAVRCVVHGDCPPQAPAPPLHEPGAAQPGAERGALCQPPGACIPGRSRGRRLRTDRRR